LYFTVNVKTISNLPIFVFAFTCHQNLFAIFNELEGDRKKVDMVVVTSNITAFIVYMIIGICGYLTYGQIIRDNILLNFPKTVVSVISRISITILVSFSYPLQIHPCRISITNILRNFTEKVPHTVEHFGISLIIMSGTFLVAFFLSDLSIVFSIIGATGSTMLCYILPGLFYFTLQWNKSWKLKKIGALALVILGFLVMISSLVSITLNALGI